MVVVDQVAQAVLVPVLEVVVAEVWSQAPGTACLDMPVSASQ